MEDPGTLGKKRIAELCKMLIDYDTKFSFWCFIRADTFDESDIPLIKLMKEAGIYNINMGIEAANDQDLLLYNKRATLADNNRSVDLFRYHGIDIAPGFIMLNPYSTKDTLKQNYEFLSRHSIESVFFYTTILSVYKGTQIYDTVNKDKLLKSNYLEPSKYHFIDEFASDTNDFLIRRLRKSPSVIGENEITLLWYLVLSLKRFFPDEAAPYFEEIRMLRKQLANESKQYFKIIYVDNDLEHAEQCFQDFEKRVLDIYALMSNVKLRMLKKEPFRSYYLREKF